MCFLQGVYGTRNGVAMEPCECKLNIQQRMQLGDLLIKTWGSDVVHCSWIPPLVFLLLLVAIRSDIFGE